MLVYQRWWTNVKPTLIQRLVSAGKAVSGDHGSKGILGAGVLGVKGV